MKLNRSLKIAVLMLLLAILTGAFLNGCASIGRGKEDATEQELSQQTDKQGTAAGEASGSSAEVRLEPVVYTGGSEKKPHDQKAGLKADENWGKHFATSIVQALDRIFPETLSEMNWNRIATVLVGILIMAMIYGLAFGLGRLPARGRGAGNRGGGNRQTGEHAGEPAPR